MNVKQLIDEILLACEGRDLSTIEVKKVVETPESNWGFNEDWEDPRVDTAGGINYPFVVLIK